MRAPADAGVLALGVLAHEEHVDVRRPAAGERARDALEQPRRPEVRPQVEPLPDLEDRAPRARRGRARTGRRPRPSAPRRARAACRARPRHHPAVLVPVGGAPGQLRPLDREARARRPPAGPPRSPPGRPRRRGAGRPGASHRRADRPGHALEVGERVVDRDDVGVLRLDVEQVRLVRRLRAVADALARDERRASRTGAGRSPSPGCSRSSSRRRGSPSRRPARPGSRRGSSRRTPDAPFLSTIVSSSRGSSRGSISTQRPPIWRSPSAGTFWSQRPPSFRLGSKPIVVKTTGRPFARAASSSRLVASTCVGQVGAERALGIGEPAAEVDRRGRPGASRA